VYFCYSTQVTAIYQNKTNTENMLKRTFFCTETLKYLREIAVFTGYIFSHILHINYNMMTRHADP